MEGNRYWKDNVGALLHHSCSRPSLVPYTAAFYSLQLKQSRSSSGLSPCLCQLGQEQYWGVGSFSCTCSWAAGIMVVEQLGANAGRENPPPGTTVLRLPGTLWIRSLQLEGGSSSSGAPFCTQVKQGQWCSGWVPHPVTAPCPVPTPQHSLPSWGLQLQSPELSQRQWHQWWRGHYYTAAPVLDPSWSAMLWSAQWEWWECGQQAQGHATILLTIAMVRVYGTLQGSVYKTKRITPVFPSLSISGNSQANTFLCLV